MNIGDIVYYKYPYPEDGSRAARIFGRNKRWPCQILSLDGRDVTVKFVDPLPPFPLETTSLRHWRTYIKNVSATNISNALADFPLEEM